MRLPLALLLLATPAAAWDFTPTPVCTLSHATATASLAVTHDPRRPEPYAIAITRTDAPWPTAPLFGIQFDGPHGLTITTGRHKLTDGNTTLTVTDTGFGNVLDGLEFNRTATALLGDAAVAFPLDGATPEVEAFRACVAALAA